MADNENLNIINHYIGYGNPNSKFWFWGIEEKWDVKKEEEEKEKDKFIHVYKSKYQKENNDIFFLNEKDFEDFYSLEKYKVNKQKDLRDSASENKTYKGILRIFNSFHSEPEKYQNDKIPSVLNNNIFTMNLFPLGKKGDKEQDFDDFTGKLFGVKNYSEWKKQKKEERVQCFLNFFNRYHCKDKIVFCLGMAHWPDFKEYISIILNGEQSQIGPNSEESFNKFETLLTPLGTFIFVYHPAWPICSEKYISKIKKELNQNQQ